MHEAGEQARRERRLEEHGEGAGLHLAPPEACHGTLGRGAADRRRVIELAGAAVRRVPVVALHRILLAGDDRARNVMARGRIAAHEAVAVGGHELRLLGGHAAPFRIADQRRGCEGRLFAAPGQRDRFIHGQRPRMVQIQVWAVAGHQRGVGKAGAVVLGREAGNRKRRLDRFAQRLRREVGSTGISLALAGVDGDADALVAVEFDGLDLVAAHRNRLPEAFGHIDLAGRGPLVAGMLEHIRGQLLEGSEGIGENGGFRHGGSDKAGKA